MTKYSIGIDPGLSGAVAVISPESLKIFDMPTMTVERNGKAKRQVSASELAERTRALNAIRVVADMIFLSPAA